MIAITCPPRERLTDYVQGRLALDVHESVETHLDDCPDCRSLVETLDSESLEPLAALRTPPPDVTLEEPSFRRLVARVKEIVPGSPSPAETSPLVGSSLGNYDLLEPVGTGGMGRVYKARHRRMNRIVALKVLAPELLRSADARARFQREVEAAARVTSPNVVAAFDAGEADGRAFLVMEFVEGGNLAELVKRDGPLPVARALEYILQAARGLAHAHAAGIIHRDVKPANLLLDRDGTVKLLDLGLARALIGDDGSGAHLTATSAAMGTPAFMSPEQATDCRAADGRADVYGLGCTLYYLVTGRPPYEGATALEVVLAHREKPIPTIPDSPTGIVSFLRTSLAKRPEDRFPTMTAVVAALERLLGRQPSSMSPRRGAYQRWAAAAAIVLTAGALTWAFVASGSRIGTPGPVALNRDAIVQPPEKTEAELEQERRIERRQRMESLINHAVTDAGKRSRSVLHFAAALSKSETERRIERRQRVESLVRHAVTNAGKRSRAVLQLTAVCALPRGPKVEMVAIKPGKFVVESDEQSPAKGKKPPLTVEISQAFELGKFEVTQEEFAAVMGTNPSHFSSNNPLLKGQDTRRHPVDSVSWLDAIRFCNRLSVRHGLPPYYQILKGDVVVRQKGPGFRLPTEAEWEYACRAGTNTRWSFGDDVAKLGQFAWFAGNSEKHTHGVGKKDANPWGLYDMYGNVPEWCWDRFQANAWEIGPEIDPSGPGIGETRVFRGGAWNGRAMQTRSSIRDSLGTIYSVERTLNYIGFRVARDVQP